MNDRQLHLERSASFETGMLVLSLGAIWATGLIGGVVIARGLGPSGKGIIAIAIAVRTYQAMIATAGWDNALVYRVAAGDAPLREAAAATIRRLMVTSATMALGVMAIYWALYAADHPVLLRGAVFCFIASSVPLTIAHGYSSAIRASGRVAEASAFLAGHAFVYLAVVAGAIFAGTAAAGVLIAASIVALAYAVVLAALGHRWECVWSPLKRQTASASLRSFARRNFIGDLFEALSGRLDLLVVGALVGAGGAGRYSVALSAADTVQLLPTAVAVVVFQRAALGKQSTSAYSGHSLLRVTSGAVFLALLPLALVGAALIPRVYGSSFAPAVPAFLVLIPGGWALAVWKTGAAQLAGGGSPMSRTASAIVATLSLIALDLLLVPRMGILGAGIASSCAYLIGAGISIFLLRRIHGLSVSALIVPTREDVSVVLAALRR